jgi:hypothetical protein
MPGLVPGIHVLRNLEGSKGVDGRNKSGHDEVSGAVFTAAFSFNVSKLSDAKRCSSMAYERTNSSDSLRIIQLMSALPFFLNKSIWSSLYERREKSLSG